MNNSANTKKKIIRLNKVLTEYLEDISKRTAKTQMSIIEDALYLYILQDSNADVETKQIAKRTLQDRYIRIYPERCNYELRRMEEHETEGI